MAFVRPPTTPEAIVEELRRLILSRELPPGAKVHQEQIAQRLGVSRVPLREGLKLLQGEGLLTYEPHRGTYVTKLSIEELNEIGDLRRLLETDAIKTALPAVTEAHLQAMKTSLEEMDAAFARSDAHGVSRGNRHFHMALVEPSGLDRHLRMLNQLWDGLEPYWSYMNDDPSIHERRQREHQAILDAVVSCDRRLVVRLLNEHRRLASEPTREQLKRLGH